VKLISGCRRGIHTDDDQGWSTVEHGEVVPEASSGQN